MPSDADLAHEARRGRKEAMAELPRRHWDIAVLLAGCGPCRRPHQAIATVTRPD